MKRYGIIILILFPIVFAALMAGAGTPKKVENSKHNMSSTPFAEQGTIKSAASGGTTEICVFCHTPHSGNTEAPLWNRALYPSAPSGYKAYTSDVLSALSYSSAEDPYASSGTGVIHAKTRICLSCHDGTIAIGRLVNLPTSFGNADPNTTFIAMQGTSGGYMPPAFAGYMGVDLSDDHPVAIPHHNLNDGELASVINTTDAPNVNLYELNAGQVRRTKTGGAGSYVECTSCHNAHDNQYGNFLVDPNTNSKICTSCHDKKTGFTASSHNTSGAIYAPDSGSLGGTVGDVKCMNCHFPHKAGVTAGAPTNPNPASGKYLLSFQEEASCFNNTNRWGDSVTVCHGSNAPPARSIENLVKIGGKSRFHQVGESSWTGRHAATEARQYIAGVGWSGSSLWHVECEDCHNPHTAGSTLHTKGSNEVGNTSPLYGTGGVDAGTYPPWPANSTSINYSAIQAGGVTNNTPVGVLYEYQICLKCHSDFAWGTNRPVPTLTNPLDPSYTGLTNQAMEFGNNATPVSSHPVIFANGNSQGTYVSPWTANTEQTMYCSDCHNNDSARAPFGAGSDAAGPHGSNNRAILKKPYDPATIGSNNGELCFDCHDFATYSTGLGTGTGFRSAALNLHTRHMAPVGSGGVTYQNSVTKACTNCHVNPPHGINRTHLISLSTASTLDPAPYGSYSYLTRYSDVGPGSYVAGSCAAVSCHNGGHPQP